MVGRATTKALRFLYAAFALVWVGLAIRSARAGDRLEAIAYGAVAFVWLVVVASIIMRPSRWGR
jgi:hypothetical protein